MRRSRGRRNFRRRFTRRRFARRRFIKRVARATRTIAEKKVLTIVAPGGTQVGTAGYAQILNIPPVGTGKGERIGNRIFGRYLKIKFTIDISQASATGTVVSRVSIVRARTAGLTLADMPVAGSTEMWDSDKWEVVWDKRAIQGTLSTDGKDVWIRDITLRCFKPMLFNDNNSNSVTNQYWIFARTSDGGLVMPTFVFTCLFTFTDL